MQPTEAKHICTTAKSAGIFICQILFLFDGVPSAFDNPHNVCGTVTYNECWSNNSCSTQNGFVKKSVLGSKKYSKTTINITNISDESWWIRFDEAVKYDSCHPFNKREIHPLGGNAHFTVTSGKTARMYFIDVFGQEHMHTCCKAVENITIVCPTINFVYRKITQSQSVATTVGHSTILVLGRFGSGKSTLLNSLAGTYWKGKDGKQKVPGPVVEKFQASGSYDGCTKVAILEEITTFDGRNLTVIDTVGYDDQIGEDKCDSESLTKVMNQHEFVSAIVIVMNSADRRISHGLLESLLCIPMSFNQAIKNNVAFVWTNWSADDEEEFGDEENRGFTSQLNVIRTALGFDENENIPSFWVDNRKTCPKQHTIDNLTRFLDKVDSMPPLSCSEFKEMRAISLYARIVRKGITEYFMPSPSEGGAEAEVNHSKFEQLLFNCSNSFSEENKNTKYFSPEKFQNDLVRALEQRVPAGLNEDIDKICKAACTTVWGADLLTFKDRHMTSMGREANKSFIGLGIGLMLSLSVFTSGLSLAALPLLIPSVLYQAKGWSRDRVIQHVVFTVNNDLREKYCFEYTNKFTSHVDKMAQDLKDIFERERERKRDAKAM
jgi:energy-coupling factor transporter ATP-binding protein EcfA2